MIYFDNSATSYPKPKSVIEAQKNAMLVYGANPGRAGHKMAMETGEKIYEVREKIAQLFGASMPDNVAFTMNCTNALNYAIKGNVVAGMHILTSDIEHNSVIRPLEKMRLDGLITFDIFETDPYNDENTLKNITSLIKPETGMIVCTHASNVLGILNPINKIGKLCKEKGFVFIVDAAQSAGILPISIEEDNIDFLCMPGHKGLLGPMGTGVIVSGGKMPVTTIVEGGTGSLSNDPKQPLFMPDVFEAGTLNVPGIIALGEGVSFIEKKGMKNIYSLEKAHIIKIYNFLKENDDFETYINLEKIIDYSPIISVNLKSVKSEDFASYLSSNGIYVRAGLQCAPSAHRKIGTIGGGTVRISPSFFTTNQQINYAISTMKNASHFF